MLAEVDPMQNCIRRNRLASALLCGIRRELLTRHADGSRAASTKERQVSERAATLGAGKNSRTSRSALSGSSAQLPSCMTRPAGIGGYRHHRKNKTKSSEVGGRRSTVGTSESRKGKAHERGKSGGSKSAVGRGKNSRSEQSKRNERAQRQQEAKRESTGSGAP